jgi:hypothetical protein
MNISDDFKDIISNTEMLKSIFPPDQSKRSVFKLKNNQKFSDNIEFTLKNEYNEDATKNLMGKDI